MPKNINIWHVYILKCRDSSLYAGITNNVQKRFEVHLRGKGGKYTRTHTPESIVYKERCGTRSEALKREAAIKRLPRSKKLELIRAHGLI